MTVVVEQDYERHEMPDGSMVWYRNRDHSYWRGVKRNKAGEIIGGEGRLQGCSTVVAPLDFRPDALLDWACRVEAEGIAEIVSEFGPMTLGGGSWLRTADGIRDRLAAYRLLHTDVRDRSAKRGTNVHKHALYALATGRPVPDFDQLTEEEQGYARGVMAFWHEHEPEVLNAEQVVWHDELGIAGRFDLRCYLDGIQSVRCLVDAKTGWVGAKAHGQLRFYDLCALSCGIGASDDLWILQVEADGTYDLIPVQCREDVAIAALRTYRGAAEINRLAAADRRAL